jgi:hypothetical protein
VGESVIYAIAEDSGGGFGFLALATSTVQATKPASQEAVTRRHEDCIREGGKMAVGVDGRCKRCGEQVQAPQAGAAKEKTGNPWIDEE